MSKDETTEKVGTILSGSEGRDAIHIAVAPMVAAEKLSPGQHIGLMSDGKAGLRAAKHIGIVDPFLGEFVKQGQLFYMFLYPGTITGLRHEWTHPAFAAVAPTLPASVEPSNKWIIDFCKRVGRDYDSILEIAGDAIDNGSAHVGTDDDQDKFDAEKRDFLHHAAIVLGKVPPDPESVYFSCAC